jgi:hypothetical protein
MPPAPGQQNGMGGNLKAKVGSWWFFLLRGRIHSLFLCLFVPFKSYTLLCFHGAKTMVRSSSGHHDFGLQG